jgi:acetylornithine deacetylase/succinyl-diaminopimelate desuccinylase-like protein
VSTLDVLQKLVEFPTYESNGMSGCADFLRNELEHVGFNASVDTLSNVYASREFARGEGAFLINTHFDTIPPSTKWSRNPLQVTVESDHLYGLGTSDSKGGIAAILCALRDLNESRFKKLEVLFTNYEDNVALLDGKRWSGARYFLTHNRLESRVGINAEGTIQGDRFMVSLGCGGRVAFDVTVMGKEAHTAEPSWRTLGRNAIYDMMKVIDSLRKMPGGKMAIDDYTVHTELNVSVIHGGTALNIVPGECKIECERRFLPNENWDEVKMMVEKVLGTLRDVEYKVHFYEPQRAYLLDRTNPVVALAVESVQRTLGYTPRLRIDAGRTDSNQLDELAGIKTFIMGPGEGPMTEHKPDEYASARRIDEFYRIMRSMLSKSE